MKKASMKLFDLVYGELFPVESKIFGKMVFIFYTIDDKLLPQIVYYPSTKEVKTLREIEVEFSSYIPLHRDEFIIQFSNWVRERYSEEMIFKGIEYVDFLEELLV
jgi:hypothetical protein